MTLKGFILCKVFELRSLVYIRIFSTLKKSVGDTFLFPKNKGKLEEATNGVSNMIEVAWDLRMNHIILTMEYTTEVDISVKISNG